MERFGSCQQIQQLCSLCAVQPANAIAFGVYILVHYLDQDNAALYKFADSLNALEAKAKAFQTAAGAFASAAGEFKDANSVDKVQKFQVAAQRFKEAAEAFLKLADKILQETTTTWGNKIQKKAQLFHNKAKDFATAAKAFHNEALLVGVSGQDDGHDNAQKDLGNIKTKFANTSGQFAHTSGDSDPTKGAAAKLHNAFEQFETGIASNRTKAQLKTQLGDFKDALGPGGNNFQGLAQAFNSDAQQVDQVNGGLTEGGKVKEAIAAFKAAADAFGATGTGAAKLLYDLAEQLNTIASKL